MYYIIAINKEQHIEKINEGRYRQSCHSVFQLHAHLVFITKYRRTVFSGKHLDSMKDLLDKICLSFEAKLIEFEGEDNHVHLLINYPPKLSLSKLIHSLKGITSRRLKQLHPDLIPKYRKGALWSPSYFAGSCGGAPIEIIRQYIEQQNRPI